MKKIFTLYNLMYISTYLAAVVLCAIIISVSDYLLVHKIVKLEQEWFKYPYSFGIGVLCYFPVISLFKQLKK